MHWKRTPFGATYSWQWIPFQLDSFILTPASPGTSVGTFFTSNNCHCHCQWLNLLFQSILGDVLFVIRITGNILSVNIWPLQKRINVNETLNTSFTLDLISCFWGDQHLISAISQYKVILKWKRIYFHSFSPFLSASDNYFHVGPFPLLLFSNLELGWSKSDSTGSGFDMLFFNKKIQASSNGGR